LEALALDGRLFGFRKGYENGLNKQEMFEENEADRRVSYMIIELALVLTHD